jgi:hypothetical protein
MGIDILAPSFSSYSHLMTVKEEKRKKRREKEQHLSKKISNYQLTKAIDVFGKEVEPICD